MESAEWTKLDEQMDVDGHYTEIDGHGMKLWQTAMDSNGRQ
jgi:hypothetical protein